MQHLAILVYPIFSVPHCGLLKRLGDSVRKPVARDSWKLVPFEGGQPFTVNFEVSDEEFELIKLGHLPAGMDDKWFIFYEEPYLYLHRSWTGKAAYRLAFVAKENGAVASEAILCMNHANWDLKYHVLLLDFLLGKQKPFPLPANTEGEIPGVLQHQVSGSGFPEFRVTSPKPWWRFW
jgi:hypothetical protein